MNIFLAMFIIIQKCDVGLVENNVQRTRERGCLIEHVRSSKYFHVFFLNYIRLPHHFRINMQVISTSASW